MADRILEVLYLDCFGVSTDFALSNSLGLTPADYYQSSWEDTVNTEDEAWLNVNMKYAF